MGEIPPNGAREGSQGLLIVRKRARLAARNPRPEVHATRLLESEPHDDLPSPFLSEASGGVDKAEADGCLAIRIGAINPSLCRQGVRRSRPGQ